MKFRRIMAIAAAATLCFSLAACQNGKNETSAEGQNESEASGALELPQLEEPEAGETIAVMSTSKGDIKLRFFPEYAPKAVENFLTHAKDGYYDGLTFHRVINEFMIQGGDPKGDGTGGESIWGDGFELETTPSLRHFRGALAMAHSSEPNSNGSQFYIVQCTDIGDENKQAFEEAKGMQDEEIEDGSGVYYKDIYPTEVLDEYINNGGCPFLDNGYTVFGQVIEGMEVVDDIAAVETDDSDKPLEDVIINSITVEEY